jgi:hypothetical protein
MFCGRLRGKGQLQGRSFNRFKQWLQGLRADKVICPMGNVVILWGVCGITASALFSFYFFTGENYAFQTKI